MRKHAKRAFSLMLVLCMTAGSLPCMRKVETANAEAVTNYAESEDVVRGFGNKIKDKEPKKAKVNVNKENKNGKAWNREMIQAEVTENYGEPIKVAVIDSGINFSTDLNVVARKNFIPEDERSVLYEDPTGHGTAVAGIIGALDNEEGVTGVNPGVELYSARVLDEKLEAPVERIVEAIDWAIEQDVDIINMSFGISKNVAELEAAIEKAAEADILLIAAAGDGEEVAYPAAYDEVIAVGSVTAAGIPAENSADGEALELMAPGENILSSGIFGGVMGVSGTSMATPHVAGAASVLMELNPDMPADYIRALLNYSANLYGDSNEYGNGVIDLEYAIEINDKFKKLYEKNITKEAKNEKQKEKQKEKFWGEVLKTIPENEKAVETFTDVDVVEGMWNSVNHTYLTQTAGDELEDETEHNQPIDQISFTITQMQIMIQANYDADTDSKLKNMDANPYHGYYQSYKNHDDISGVTSADYPNRKDVNYVANYIYLAKRANAFGSGNSAPFACTAYIKNFNSLAAERQLMIEIGKERIDSDITGSKIGSKTWANALQAVGVTESDENKKFYIWGLALHCATDTFAHSGFAVFNGSWDHIRHYNEDHTISYADNVDFLPERYAAALEVAKKVLYHAYYGSAGLVTDFRIPGSYFGNFYLKNIADYCKDVNSTYYNAFISDFNAMDYNKHGSN